MSRSLSRSSPIFVPGTERMRLRQRLWIASSHLHPHLNGTLTQIDIVFRQPSEATTIETMMLGRQDHVMLAYSSALSLSRSSSFLHLCLDPRPDRCRFAAALGAVSFMTLRPTVQDVRRRVLRCQVLRFQALWRRQSLQPSAHQQFPVYQ